MKTIERALLVAACLAGGPQVLLAEDRPGVGADVPFLTFEAEDQHTTGRVVRLRGLPAPQDTSPELEASGRAFVELTAPGQFIDVPDAPEANAMVLRHCIPDAPAGGGLEAELGLYVNGEFRQSLTLSSRNTWLYGRPGRNGQSNNPADGEPHVYWEDLRYFIAGGVKAGDTLRLQHDGGDAAFYWIDLVDLETAPPPLAQPENSLSVADYGATGDDDTDDTDAIARCIADAKAQGKAVWIPAGRYHQSSKFTLDGVTVRGAGMWHTELVGTTEAADFAGTLGFILAGDGAAVSDMYITTLADTARVSRSGSRPFTGVYDQTINWRVENVWMHRVHNAFWMSGCDKGLVRGCRVYLAYADGININRGSRDCVIEHNYVRGVGDDGVVFLSEETLRGEPNRMAMRNTVRRNTVIANWWGHNAAIGGGDGHVVEDNYLADNSHAGCLTINLPNAFPKYPLTNTLVQRNTVVRGGSDYAGSRRGAVWLNTSYTTAADGIVFRDNRIIDALFRGIHVTGEKTQHVLFENNLVDNPGEIAVYVSGNADGSGTFVGNTFRNLNPAFEPFVNDSGNYRIEQRDNHIEQETAR